MTAFYFVIAAALIVAALMLNHYPRPPGDA